MHATLEPKILDILHSKGGKLDNKLQELCEFLKEQVPYYDWVGFYFRNGSKEELKLGP